MVYQNVLPKIIYSLEHVVSICNAHTRMRVHISIMHAQTPTHMYTHTRAHVCIMRTHTCSNRIMALLLQSLDYIADALDEALNFKLMAYLGLVQLYLTPS